MSEITERKIAMALGVLEIDATKAHRHHFRVLAEAMQVFVERDAVRSGSWARAGAKGATVNLFAKAERVWQMAMAQHPEDEVVDDLLDLINYTVFCFHCLTADNLDGEWPWDKINT